MFVGTTADDLNPPTDEQSQALIEEVTVWNADMALLFRFLRETGMRLAEALHLHAEDIHPDGLRATLVRVVKRNKDGLKTRTINLGRAAELLDGLPKRGRLFARLHTDSAVVSTRYGQWRRQRQGREERSAADEGREAENLQKFRIHDFRHAFAIAGLIDDDTCLIGCLSTWGIAQSRPQRAIPASCGGWVPIDNTAAERTSLDPFRRRRSRGLGCGKRR